MVFILTFKKFKSDYFKQTLDTIKLFKGLYNDIFWQGILIKISFIDESINIEIMPIQSKDNYLTIRKILNENYSIDNFECDSLFEDYSVDKFHFHVKIKYSVDGMIIKFYNTYPINPFINYYDN